MSKPSFYFMFAFMFAPLPLAASSAAPARTIHFLTDNGPQEQKYLWKHSSRNFVLAGWGKPVRNLDGKDQFVIWRFDMTGVSAAQLRPQCFFERPRVSRSQPADREWRIQ